MRKTLHPKLLAAAVAATIAIPASAQSVLEEVVVVAQKREQNVQDVPIAITAFTGEQMNALGVSESFDIAAFSPGVHISGNLAGQNTQFSIRGVTQNDFNDIIEAPNAVYLDEGYIAVVQAQTFAVFDIDRVEILKGPQGTLFGRNATGGLVHFISNAPSFEETTGYLDVEFGQFDTANNARREDRGDGTPGIHNIDVSRAAIVKSLSRISRVTISRGNCNSGTRTVSFPRGITGSESACCSTGTGWSTRRLRSSISRQVAEFCFVQFGLDKESGIGALFPSAPINCHASNCLSMPFFR